MGKETARKRRKAERGLRLAGESDIKRARGDVLSALSRCALRPSCFVFCFPDQKEKGGSPFCSPLLLSSGAVPDVRAGARDVMRDLVCFLSLPFLFEVHWIE